MHNSVKNEPIDLRIDHPFGIGIRKKCVKFHSDILSKNYHFIKKRDFDEKLTFFFSQIFSMKKFFYYESEEKNECTVTLAIDSKKKVLKNLNFSSKKMPNSSLNREISIFENWIFTVFLQYFYI